MSVRPLPPVLSDIAKDELNEEPGRLEKDLQAIKEWLSKQQHLKARIDDQWLVGFLRGCKFSLERTKEKIDLYYALRSAIPEMTSPIDPMEPWVQEVLSSGSCVPVPTTYSKEHPRVVIVRPGANNPDKIPTMDVMRVHTMFSSIYLLEDDISVVVGQIYLLDLKDVTFSHFTQMTPSLIKKMVATSQDALPFRQKGTHHLNSPAGSETIFNFFRRFMNEKNRNRIVMHGEDLESLHKVIPKAVLPTEYGGDGGPIQDMIDIWKKKVESYRDWFLDDVNYKSNENLRVGKPKTSETIFGIEGSFRQLSVD